MARFADVQYCIYADKEESGHWVGGVQKGQEYADVI